MSKPVVNNQTFLDHLLELRGRLLWVVALGLGAAGAAYFIKDLLLMLLLRPLHGQSLIYTAPVGGLELILKVCLLVGIVVATPAFVYHLLRFLEPALPRYLNGYIWKVLVASSLLTVSGLGFAYFVSLPAALHFLSQFHSPQITPLLSTDQYLSFVLVYLAGFAILFQIPLILLFINKIRPLPPGRLLRSQRAVILISLITAAIITPTPDPINQGIMAAPMILLYQVGIGLVWLSQKKVSLSQSLEPLPTVEPLAVTQVPPQPISLPPAVLDLRKEMTSRVVSRVDSPHVLDLRTPNFGTS